MLKSLFGVVKDVAEIVAAPVEIVADVVGAVTKPVADLAKEAVQETKEITGADKND